MALPATPIRLSVLDRVVTVLKNIVDGDAFFYRAYAVEKRMKNFNECGGFPTYMVFMNNAAGPPESHLDSEYVEMLTITVAGWVDMELGEPQSKLCKCLRDVQKAINDDSMSVVTGSLGQLTATCDIGSVETDNGGFSLQGFSYFEQQVSVRIMGNWGEL